MDTEFLREIKADLELLPVNDERQARIIRLAAMIDVAETEEKVPYYQR